MSMLYNLTDEVILLRRSKDFPENKGNTSNYSSSVRFVFASNKKIIYRPWLLLRDNGEVNNSRQHA